MDKTEQNKRIARACGWTLLEPEIHPVITYYWAYPPGQNAGSREILPDYCWDLNAIQDAEKFLKDDLLNGKWLDHLRRTVEETHGLSCSLSDYYRATSEQRAKAFLLTVGLWGTD